MKEKKQTQVQQSEGETSAKFVPKYNPAEQGQEQSEQASVLTLEQAGHAIAQKRKSRGKPMEQTARISRELTRQSSRALPALQKSLFDILSPKARENALILDEEKGLLTSIIDGIDGSEMTYKLILALAMTLYEQSELYGTKDSLTGASELLLPLFLDTEEESNSEAQITRKKNGGKTIKEEKYVASEGRVITEEKYVTSPCPLVFIDMEEFTQKVYGIDRKPTTKERNAVENFLEILKTKKAFLPADNGKWFARSLIGKERDYINTKTKERYKALELDSIFTRAIKNDFAIIRKDTLRKLSGNQKKMTMRLLFYLLGQFSYHNPVCQISKEQLFLRIAIIDAYNKNPKRREEDFQTALKKMEDCKLILPVISSKDNYGKPLYDKSGGYYEEMGADGYSLYSRFRLNPDYTKGDPVEPEKAPEVNAEDTEASDPVHNTPE